MLSAGVRQHAADHGRIGELYLGHADAAVRLAYLLTGDRALAEDLVQDASPGGSSTSAIRTRSMHTYARRL